MDAKQILSEMLAYYKYKVDNDLCTMAEIESAQKALTENMEIYGTTEDLAKFYGVSPGNVRATISRKLLAKPLRRVFYPFHKFLKIVPSKWRKR